MWNFLPAIDLSCTSDPMPGESVQWEVSFARYIGGLPLLRPDNGKFTVNLSHNAPANEGDSVTFDTHKMFFHGKFEY